MTEATSPPRQRGETSIDGRPCSTLEAFAELARRTSGGQEPIVTQYTTEDGSTGTRLEPRR